MSQKKYNEPFHILLTKSFESTKIYGAILYTFKNEVLLKKYFESKETSWVNQNISIVIHKKIWRAILYTFKTEGFWVIRNVMSHFIYIWKIVLSQPKYLSTSMVTSKRSSDWNFPGVWHSIWHEPLLISQFRAKRPQRLKIASRVTECLQFTHWNAWVCNLTWSSWKCKFCPHFPDLKFTVLKMFIYENQIQLHLID